MKIYEIGTGYTPIPARMGAATEIVVEELTKALLEQGADAEIIDIQAADRLPNRLPITEVKVPTVFAGTDVKLGIMHKMKRVVYSVCLAGKISKILRKAQEKVVLHFHNQYNLFFYLKLVSRKNKQKALIAYTNHSGIWRLPWDECRETIRKRYFQEEECMKKADIVFALNQETIDNAVTHCGCRKEKFVRINNGVNTGVYTILAGQEKERAREAFRLEGKKVILQVGSVYENKGQGRVVQWLIPMLRDNPDMVYVYAGGIVSEEYHQQIKDMVKEAGLEAQVVYLGMVQPGETLNQLYNAAEATICASQYEGFSLAIIESLAAGTPVLVQEGSPFDVGAGCVAYSGEELAGKIGETVFSPERRKQISEAARENACEHYGWSSVAREYLMHFTKAAEQ